MSRNNSTDAIEDTEPKVLPPSNDLIQDSQEEQTGNVSLGFLRRMSAAALLIASSVMLGTQDIWVHDRRRENSVLYGVVSPGRWRRIRLHEARRLALEVLAKAEEDRVIFAVEQARRDEFWEEADDL